MTEMTSDAPAKAHTVALDDGREVVIASSDDDQCGDISRNHWVCSRPIGHEAPHVACCFDEDGAPEEVMDQWEIGTNVDIDAAPPCPEPERAAWLLTALGSFGRATIQTEQYEELRGLAVAQSVRLRELEADVAELRDPGFEDFVSLARHFLRNYPADVFTGESGDPGACFVVRLRRAIDTLDAST